MIYHVVLSYYISAGAGKDASRLSIPSSATSSRVKDFKTFCLFPALTVVFYSILQYSILIVFSIYIEQLTNKIHFYHVFSWHSLNV